MTLKKMDDGIYVDVQKIDKIKNLDGIIFDCDGVLIDVSNSYDLAIKKTVNFVANKIASINKSTLVTTEMIDSFKKTGGFNDEVNVAYALILTVVASEKTTRNFSDLVFDVAKNADQTGIKSVEQYFDSIKIDLTDIKKKLAYPAKRFESTLSSIFDEIFYGKELYAQLYKKSPKFFSGTGLIENDAILVTESLLDELHKRFGKKIAIVTGRGILSARYSLKKLFDEFDLKNSRFLEDEPREMAKPNPQPLILSIKGIGASCSVFVGDSMEDLIMACKADESGNPTLFCGIYGTSKDSYAKRDFFEQKGADMVLESISLFPKALNLVRA
ncbi:MAG: HAD family hydrolase [Thaumarchaeota archaeon]|nr:HAD family hydrolase [Nitrososphaerota archaeon]